MEQPKSLRILVVEDHADLATPLIKKAAPLLNKTLAWFMFSMVLANVAGHMYGEGSLGALDFLVWDSLMDWENQQITVPVRPGQGEA